MLYNPALHECTFLESKLNVSLQAVHTPLKTPKSYIYPYRDMANVARRKFAALVSTVDEAVRNVTYALRKYGYYRNSVIIYSTDNGAQPFTGGSNWPLRGRKVEKQLLGFYIFYISFTDYSQNSVHLQYFISQCK